jgi:hypothetical protein
MARFLYRLSCAGLLGAQVFFAAGAARVVFHSGLERRVAGDLVGAMLARLDSATLAFTALAALCAVLLGQPRRAIAPLFAGLFAAASAFLITPAIHALRAGGETASPAFRRLHVASLCALGAEMILLIVAIWLAPESQDRQP